MAKKQTTARPVEKKICRNCEHSYDYHELNYKGEPFLCKCPFHRWSRFLDIDGCEENYKRRKV